MTSSRDRARSIAVWILATVALLFFLRMASALLIPIAVAVLLSYAAEPAVASLARWRVPRPFGAAVVLLVVAGAVARGIYALRDEAAAVLAAVPVAAERLAAWAGVGDPMAGGSAGVLLQGIGWVLTGAGNFTIVVMLAYFLLVSGDHFKRRVIETAGDSPKRRLTAGVFDEINLQIQRFLLVQVATSVVVGVATWLVLAWMQVPQAPIWGVAAGLFNSIPYFGPVIVSGGLLLVGLLQSGDPMVALRMSAAAMAITSIEGWVLNPLLMGRAERMHVVVVFVGVLLWTWLWGAWGTLLAVPMLVVIKAVADHFEPLQPISRLMAR